MVNKTDFLIGSFQRDTEGKDLKSPKVNKGTRYIFDIVNSLYKKIKIKNDFVR